MSDEPGTILHLDMDAFFAAVEQHDRPELRGRPVIVGAAPDKRGVVSTASYEARRFGVHSAMPSRVAFRRCPHGVFLPVRGERYREVSAEVMRIMRESTPVVEQVSIDEAFLDVSGVLRPGADSVDLAKRLKHRIRAELGLTASVGVASNKFLAKLASDMDKPDGLTVLPTDEQRVREFLAPLPVSRIWGVGQATAEQLARKGIRTIAQIQAVSLPAFARILGPTSGHHIWLLAHGRDKRPVVAEKREEKSISAEETFLEDCTDAAAVRQTLVEMTEKVGRRLRRAGKLAGVGQIKLRFADFRTITRQRSLRRPLSSDRGLLACALELYDNENVKQPVRLIGFGVSNLVSADEEERREQLLLFPEPESEDVERDAELDGAVDALRERYGADILKRGDWQR